MTAQTQHSVLPWSLDLDANWLPNHIAIDSQKWGALAMVVINVDDEASAEGRANAEFIIEACNNYELLQAVNAQLLEAISAAQNALGLYLTPDGPDQPETLLKLYEILDDKKLVAAIAAAESK